MTQESNHEPSSVLFDVDSSETVSLTAAAAAQPHNLQHDEESKPPKSKSKSMYNFKPKFRPKSRCFTITYYITLSALAILLTINSKGTSLWDTTILVNTSEGATTPKVKASISSERGVLNLNVLVSLLIHYIAVLIAFYIVQGSDPGYLTPAIMEQVSRCDGLSILGERMDGVDCQNQIRNGDDNGNSNGNDHGVVDVEQGCDATTIEMTTLNDKSKNEMTRRNHNMNQSIENNNTDLNTSLSPPSSLSLQTTTKTTNDKEKRNRKRRNICPTCNIAPPLRAHHCKHCNKCVATFDHHCAFIGTCIGERNHCRFYFFIVIQAIGFIKCISIVNSSNFGIMNFATPRLYKDVNPTDIWLVILARCYLYPLTFAACLIVGVHTWFMMTNGTTFELAKRDKLEYLEGSSMCDLPYSFGLVSNLKLFCCVRDASSKCLANVGLGNTKEEVQYNQWTPIIWKPVGTIVNDSEDWQNNLWSNKYWSCC